MRYRVTIAVDSLDPNPEVTEFEDFYEAEDFIHDSVDQSVQSLMSQSPYIISEKEYEQLLEQEMALTRLDVI
tara:strand:- start:65 stop:280 length:216 start_codon:yes stop_codon:yes gene_type:complete